VLYKNDRSDILCSMTRPKTYKPSDVARRAMERFWVQGYYATSMADLVAATGVSRHGLYADFRDKHGLFVASMQIYFEEVVTPAFALVEASNAGTAEIRQYFETQIARAEAAGLPGPGCLVANTMVEVGPHDLEFGRLVAAHLSRLTNGFWQAIENERCRREPPPTVDVTKLAFHLTVSAQGLWSFSRTTTQADLLRAYARELVDMIEEKLSA
jgi:TetR/AcrR family transcriptional regulator, transcriptional repressor for nem operon